MQIDDPGQSPAADTAGLRYRSALDRYTAAEARTLAAHRAILQVRPRRLYAASASAMHRAN